MPLKLTLELSDTDLDHFRNVMDATWQRNAGRGEEQIMEDAHRLLRESRKAEMPEYVRQRLDDVGTLISMFEDGEWPLEQKDRSRITAAINYFADPMDMIPDKTPRLGFLDDALMAELVIQELEDQLDGYREFCEFREKEEALRHETVTREDWLAAKRRQIFLRIDRRQQERRRHWSTEGPTDPILRYKY